MCYSLSYGLDHSFLCHLKRIQNEILDKVVPLATIQILSINHYSNGHCIQIPYHMIIDALDGDLKLPSHCGLKLDYLCDLSWP